MPGPGEARLVSQVKLAAQEVLNLPVPESALKSIENGCQTTS